MEKNAKEGLFYFIEDMRRDVKKGIAGFYEFASEHKAIRKVVDALMAEERRSHKEREKMLKKLQKKGKGAM